MEKWYKKNYYIITNKNFISVFLILTTIFFYFLEHFFNTGGGISTFLVGMMIGQEIGYWVEKAKKNN